jgi:(2Fe-2S) ferredoxin
MAKRPIVLLCRGSDCRKRRKKRSALVDALRPVATIEEVGCQDICDGPVAGTLVEGTLEWFREVDGEKARRALVELLVGGKLARPLRKRRVAKRAGRRR